MTKKPTRRRFTFRRPPIKKRVQRLEDDHVSGRTVQELRETVERLRLDLRQIEQSLERQITEVRDREFIIALPVVRR